MIIAVCKIKNHERLRERIACNYPQVSLEWVKTKHYMEIHKVPGKFYSREALRGIKAMIKQHDSGLEVVRT